MLQRKQRENRNVGVDVWDNVRLMKKKAKRVSIYDFEDVGPCAGCCDGCNDCGRNSTPHAALISQLNKSRVELIVENKKLKDEISRHPEKNMIEALVKEAKKLKEEKKLLETALKKINQVALEDTPVYNNKLRAHIRALYSLSFIPNDLVN